MFTFQLRLISVLSFLVLSMSAAPASATVYSFTIDSGGLDDGHACLSSTGVGLCASSALFAVDATYAITGGFDYDDIGAGSIDLDITLTSGKLTGIHDGVELIEFIDTNYTATWTTAFFLGGTQLMGSGTASGTVDGDYEQFDSGLLSVVGPDVVFQSAGFTGFSCLFPTGLSGNAQCGFTVGGNRDFTENVGVTGSGDPFDFRHTFNFTVPEPSTAGLLAMGLVVVAARRRRL